MSHPLTYTACRLIGQKRTGTKRAIAYGFTDGEGGLFREITITYHFENGTYERVLTFPDEWDNDDAEFEETSSTYDPEFNGGTEGSGYGDPEDPAETYEFGNEITATAIQTYMETTATVEWGSWQSWFEVATTSTATSHGLYDVFSQTLSSTSFTLEFSDNAAGLTGFRLGNSTHLEPRFMLATPIPAKIRLKNGDDDASTEDLSPSGPLEPGPVKVELDVEHALVADRLEFLPWL